MEELDRIPISDLKGIGPGRAQQFASQGIKTVSDLLEYYPRQYLDERTRTAISDIQPGTDVLIRARLISEPKNFHKGRFTITNARAADETGQLALVWFNQPFMVKNLKAGEIYLFRGRVKQNYSRLQLVSPEVRKAENSLPGLVPVYPLGGGLTQKVVFSATGQALDKLEPDQDMLPPIYRQDMLPYDEAVRAMHRPETFSQVEKGRERLVFDELMIQQLALRRVRAQRQKDNKGVVIRPDLSKVRVMEKSLPYSLTDAQKRTLDEILKDLASDRAMSRLVQGDVGSGKTIVAFLAAYAAYLCGYQTALMAPTEVLAKQHLESAQKLLAPAGMKVALLTGSVSGKDRQSVLEGLASGSIDFVIGTHALISDPVVFHDPGLVITDEQHRFGVRQRLALSEKGAMTNVLVMTATPIPRTLAMILYGDMDISIIDQMPPGRTPVRTFSVDTSYEPRLYAFMRKQVRAGRQVYIICPMVEESAGQEDADTSEPYMELDSEEKEEKSENAKLPLRPAVQYRDFLQKEVFPDLTVGLLHGKMKPKEKEAVMEAFALGHVQILVSTTVVEVGVNVPNATLMVVENAERFGLAQLHQLRGRVGRGSAESFCVLVSDSHSVLTRKRLKTLCDSTDGFYIAEEDLHLRGAGDVFGLRQHGLPDFKLADLYRDTGILHKAQQLAETIMETDPDLNQLEHRKIRLRLDQFMDRAVTEG